MNNPFEVLNQRFDLLEAKLEAINAGSVSDITQSEIIDRKELCKRLELSVPTVLLYERKGKIPCIRIGDSVRYNWQAVMDAIEMPKK